MLFASNVFLFVFLPVVLVIYYGLLKNMKTAKNIFLLIASLFFYAWGEPVYVFLMIASIVLNYLFGILIDSYRSKIAVSRLIMILMVVTNLGILGWFKYSGFFVSQIDRFLNLNIPVPVVSLPIGISFFTFQAMSYCVDVYRNDAKVQKNIFYVGLYISLFPQLIAGPIVRYQDVEYEIENRVENWKDFTEGITRFCVGLIKKTLIANNVAVIADASFNLVYNGQYHSTTSMAWLGAIAYTLQILFDFSGYSDMAIGLGKMFGFHFKENFNYPYISKSIGEFWRRWHMSLQTWFRDYVYIPLGGNRVGKFRYIFNVCVVWVLTGIWHGANWTFLAWGIFNLIFLLFERFSGISKKEHWWGHIYALVLIVLGWTMFRATNTGEAFVYYKAMFGLGGTGLFDGTALAYIKQEWIYILMGVIASMPVISKLDKKFCDNKLWQVIYGAGVIILTGVSISFIINNAYNPFIYFNF